MKFFVYLVFLLSCFNVSYASCQCCCNNCHSCGDFCSDSCSSDYSSVCSSSYDSCFSDSNCFDFDCDSFFWDPNYCDYDWRCDAWFTPGCFMPCPEYWLHKARRAYHEGDCDKCLENIKLYKKALILDCNFPYCPGRITHKQRDIISFFKRNCKECHSSSSHRHHRRSQKVRKFKHHIACFPDFDYYWDLACSYCKCNEIEVCFRIIKRHLCPIVNEMDLSEIPDDPDSDKMSVHAIMAAAFIDDEKLQEEILFSMISSQKLK